MSRRSTLGVVVAIIYRHVDDGQLYVHGFGSEEPNIRTLADGVALTGLVDDGQVMAVAQRDGSVVLRSRDGSPVWQEFPG